MIKINNLPVVNQFDQFQNIWKDYNCVAVKSPTGSGKSIGLPLMISQKNLVSGQILVVQPRRIAARFLARTVSTIRGTKLGEEIGYQVRFENKTSELSKVIYITDGILLRILLSDPTLSRVGCVIFDEFHERSIQMDASLAIVRRLIITDRPSLKIVVTSATLDTEKIKDYLPSCNSIEFGSRSYPVEIAYRKANKNLLQEILEVLKRLLDQRDGDVLVFMDGSASIHRLVREIHKLSWSNGILVFPLFGEMSIKEQERVIGKSQKRRIIVSTNLAETSITIDGIKSVIDSGKAKKSCFDQTRGVNTLLSTQISKSSADQRAGRSGRNSPGFCIRMWSKQEQEMMDDYDSAEIFRIDLSEIQLNLKGAGLSIEDLEWFEEPKLSSIRNAEKTLQSLGLVNEVGQIQSEGYKIARIPMHPRLSISLSKGQKKDCLSALALILAISESRKTVQNENLHEFCLRSQTRMKEKISSDLWGLLEAYNFAKENEFDFERCNRSGIHVNRMLEAESIAIRLCSLMGQEFNFVFPSYEALVKILIEVFPFRICQLKSEARKLYNDYNGTNIVSSQLGSNPKSKWVLCLDVTEKNKSNRIILEMNLVSEIKEQWIVEVLKEKLKFEKTLLLDMETRRVSSQSYHKLGQHRLNLTESFDLSKTEKAKAYASALLEGELNFKNWNEQVRQFLMRIKFLNKYHNTCLVKEIDNEILLLLFEEICLKESTWKSIKSCDIYDYLFNMHSENEIQQLHDFVPSHLSLIKEKKPFLLDYTIDEVFISVKIQDLYDIKVHPTILHGEFPLTICILAPNMREVQRTRNITEFWDNSYPSIRRELAGRYPKHEWR